MNNHSHFRDLLMNRRLALSFALALSALPSPGCGGEPSGTLDDPRSPLPEDRWTVIEPGGESVCSRGTPFSFFAHGGDPERLVISFQGGGACWSLFTCGVGQGQIFFDEVLPVDELEPLLEQGTIDGLYDLTDERNPAAGATFVHIPYCTGDLHWGDATVAYGEETVIEHRGARNVRAVFDWLQARYPSPSEIFVTGCSAGSYASILYAGQLADLYPDARIVQLGDAGAGVVTDTFFQDAFTRWNAEPLLEGLIDVPLAGLTLNDLYVAVGRAHPELKLAQYNSAFDSVQGFYFEAMGGDADEWSAEMIRMQHELRDELENFRFFIGPGRAHCCTPYDALYKQGTPQTALDAWTRELVEGDELPPDVTCETSSCTESPLCEFCEAQPDAPEGAWYCRDACPNPPSAAP